MEILDIKLDKTKNVVIIKILEDNEEKSYELSVFNEKTTLYISKRIQELKEKIKETERDIKVVHKKKTIPNKLIAYTLCIVSSLFITTILSMIPSLQLMPSAIYFTFFMMSAISCKIASDDIKARIKNNETNENEIILDNELTKEVELLKGIKEYCASKVKEKWNKNRAREVNKALKEEKNRLYQMKLEAERLKALKEKDDSELYRLSQPEQFYIKSIVKVVKRQEQYSSSSEELLEDYVIKLFKERKKLNPTKKNMDILKNIEYEFLDLNIEKGKKR